MDVIIKGFKSLQWVNRTSGVNPLSPHNALKHHLKSLKTDLIVL